MMGGMAKTILTGVGIAMVATALFLPGRGQAETTAFKYLLLFSSGSIKTAEGR